MRSTEPRFGSWAEDDTVLLETDFVEDGETVRIVGRSEWVSGQLIVLTHARNAWIGVGGTTASFRVEVQNVVLDESAPDVDFVETSRTIATLTAVNSASAVPRYQVVALTPPIGPSLRVRWVFEQGALQATTALTLSVSVYLVGRRS